MKVSAAIKDVKICHQGVFLIMIQDPIYIYNVVVALIFSIIPIYPHYERDNMVVSILFSILAIYPIITPMLKEFACYFPFSQCCPGMFLGRFVGTPSLRRNSAA